MAPSRVFSTGRSFMGSFSRRKLNIMSISLKTRIFAIYGSTCMCDSSWLVFVSAKACYTCIYHREGQRFYGSTITRQRGREGERYRYGKTPANVRRSLQHSEADLQGPVLHYHYGDARKDCTSVGGSAWRTDRRSPR